mmetsp:Transcript_2752/g.3847  ORF Transcript_2752/g.3847 Transcript_2752/m.3847 type:complete len:83 (+) Transcript_2752:351-599(+)
MCSSIGSVTPKINHLLRVGGTERIELSTDTALKALNISIHTSVVKDRVCGSARPEPSNNVSQSLGDKPISFPQIPHLLHEES